MSIPSARLLHDAVLAALQAVLDNVFDGEVPDSPPKDGDQRVQAYVVLYSGAGRAYTEAVCATPTDLNWPFQITCVGGDETRCLWAIDATRSALTGRRLIVAGASVGLIREDGDLGPIRRDDAVQPPRHYLPLLYRLDATAA